MLNASLYRLGHEVVGINRCNNKTEVGPRGRIECATDGAASRRKNRRCCPHVSRFSGDELGRARSGTVARRSTLIFDRGMHDERGPVPEKEPSFSPEATV